MDVKQLKVKRVQLVPLIVDLVQLEMVYVILGKLAHRNLLPVRDIKQPAHQDKYVSMEHVHQ